MVAETRPDMLGGLVVLSSGVTPNTELREGLRTRRWPTHSCRMILETPKPQGMPLSGQTMQTLVMIGRFVQQWSLLGGRWSYVFRPDVKLHLCGRPTATDTNVRRALLDRFGGEQRPQKCGGACKGRKVVGRAKTPCPDCDGTGLWREAGPIHGVVSHALAALAVACWWVDVGVVQQDILNPGKQRTR